MITSLRHWDILGKMNWSLFTIFQNDHQQLQQSLRQTFNICVLLCFKCVRTLEEGFLSHWASQWGWQAAVPLSDFGWTWPSEAQLHFRLLETKPLIASSVWSQLSPNLRPVPLLIISDWASLPTLLRTSRPTETPPHVRPLMIQDRKFHTWF